MQGAGRARFQHWIFILGGVIGANSVPMSAHASVPSHRVTIPVTAAVSSEELSRDPAQEANSGPLIRVRLEHLKTSFTISGVALGYPGATENPGLQNLRIDWQPQSGGRRLWMIFDRDSGRLITRFVSAKFEIAGDMIRVNLKPAPSHLTVNAGKGLSSVDLIANMNLETYVRGVLPAEMPHDWPLEALKAQAVAARSFALFRMRDSGNARRTFDVETDVMDQVFLMPTAQRLEKVEQAMTETRGIALHDRHGRPFAAYFHADCGGQTEEAHEVWGLGEKQGVAIDGGCPLNPRAKWRASVTPTELNERLAKWIPAKFAGLVAHEPTSGGAAGIGSMLAGGMSAGESFKSPTIKILSRSKSGRVSRVLVAWNDGAHATLSGNDFRGALGFDRIRSTSFEMETRADGGYDLVGKGYGHGVGLCQWGARYMAQQGKSYRQILAHYYPLAR